jgi:hypothetical protein
MKKLFISLLAVAALASCAKEDVIVADPGELIAFNSFVENSTRANDPSYSTTTGKGVALTTFKVYGAVEGVNIYDGDNVTKGSAAYGAAWACDGQQQYWIAGANYVFDAVVDATTVKTDANTGLPVTLTYDATTQKDMLHDRVTTVGKPTTNNGLVAFGFTHLLSKINFTVTNTSTEAEGYSFVVRNINFAGNVKGDYNVANSTWGNFTTGNTVVGNVHTVDAVEVKDIVVASKAASAELAKEVLFIPGTYTITFTVDILYNGNVLSTVNYPAEGTTYSHTLVANNAYNFNVNVSVGDPIQFTATALPDWNYDINGNGTADDDITLQ